MMSAVAVLLSDDVILMRPPTPDDVDEWLAGDVADQIHWFDLPGPTTRGTVERAIANWGESWRAAGTVRHWAICDRETDAIVGGVQLRDLGDGTVDLSYAVFPAWRRRGIATRACRLALSYAAGMMDRRDALFKVRQGNAAALAVARNVGATVTGLEVDNDAHISIVLRVALESAR
jgi:RimJ/RimL family protein N-acetyltransferase